MMRGGDKCWLGAGCFNRARPVLRGVEVSIGQGENIVTPQAGNQWKTVNTNPILNPKALDLLAVRTGNGLMTSGWEPRLGNS